MGRAFVLYSGARVLAFAVCYAVLFAVGLRGLLAIAVALLFSSILSLVLLRRQRDALGTAFALRREHSLEEKARLRGMLDEDRPEA